MVGRTYLLRGRPVTVLARWQEPSRDNRQRQSVCRDCGLIFIGDCDQGNGILGPVAPRCEVTGSFHFAIWRPRSAVRNVLLRRADGSLTVRPFRGLRRPT